MPSQRLPDTSPPDTRRNITAGEVARIIGHPSFAPQRPENIREKDWPAALSKAVAAVRQAVEDLELDEPLPDPKNRDLITPVCKAVDAKAEAAGGKTAELLADPAVMAVRQEIGSFLRIRAYLGRNQFLPQFLTFLKEYNGTIAIGEAEEQYKAFLAMMRFLVKRSGATGAARKQAVWQVIKEFLAEQAGLSKVVFEGQKFEEEPRGGRIATAPSKTGSGGQDPAAALKRRGVELTHIAAIRSATARMAKLDADFRSAVEEHMKAIRTALDSITAASADIAGKRKGSDAETARLGKDMADYDQAKKELDAAVASALHALQAVQPGATELPPKFRRAYKEKLAALEKRFAAPLAELREAEAKSQDLLEQQKALGAAKHELSAEMGRFKAMQETFGGSEGGPAARHDVDAIAPAAAKNQAEETKRVEAFLAARQRARKTAAGN